MLLVPGSDRIIADSSSDPVTGVVRFEPGQTDLGWLLLCGLKRLGLVWDLVLPRDLPPRPALMTLPGHDRRRCAARQLLGLGRS